MAEAIVAATEVQPQAPVAEATQQVAPKEEALSPKYVVLAKREKELRAQQRGLAAREAALKAKEAEYQSSYIPLSKIKEDPFSVLSQQGVSYDDIVNAALNQPSPQDQALKALEKKIQELNDQHTKSIEAQSAQQDMAYKQAVSQLKVEASALVSSDASYEMIKATGSEDAVVELITETFEQSGRQKLLTVEEASKAVEEYLLEQAAQIARLSKVQKLLAPAVEAKIDAPVSGTKKNQPVSQVKTLTNAVTANPSRKASEKDRIARAIAAFKGQAI